MPPDRAQLEALLKRVVLCVGLVSVGVVYGIASYRYQLPPYSLIWSRPPDPDTATWPRRVSESLRPVTTTDVRHLRERIITTLWGVPRLPSHLPASIETGVRDVRLPPGAKSADRLIVSMDFGLESLVYHFHPARPNNHLFVFHHGHVGEMDTATIGSLLLAGYSVVSLAMPYDSEYGLSQGAVGEGDAKRPQTHGDFRRLQPVRGHAVRYFVEPVIVALNHVEVEYDYTTISMLGLSGGGWTTTVASAIDTRIKSSFPVAGSYPDYLREHAGSSTKGDWEQSAGLYETSSYLELYLLGSQGRRQLQIINRYDPCCFGGTEWLTYRDSVQARLPLVGGGSFDVFMDESHREHIISEVGLRRILSEMPPLAAPASSTGRLPAGN